MDLMALLNQAKDWSPTVLFPVLLYVLWTLIQKIDRNSAADHKRSQELKTFVAEEIGKMEDRVVKELDDVKRRVSILEMDALRKEEFYRENSGWRQEINNLGERMNTMMSDFMKSVIEIWKTKDRTQ